MARVNSSPTRAIFISPERAMFFNLSCDPYATSHMAFSFGLSACPLSRRLKYFSLPQTYSSQSSPIRRRKRFEAQPTKWQDCPSCRPKISKKGGRESHGNVAPQSRSQKRNYSSIQHYCIRKNEKEN